MSTVVTCPSCGITDLDLRQYYSMMVLSNTQALFTVRCPHCDKVVSVVETIPDELYDEVCRAAERVNAGMGQIF